MPVITVSASPDRHKCMFQACSLDLVYVNCLIESLVPYDLQKDYVVWSKGLGSSSGQRGSDYYYFF